MEKITVLLLIAALAGSEASSLFRASKGACPVVTTKPNFQIDRVAFIFQREFIKVVKTKCLFSIVPR